MAQCATEALWSGADSGTFDYFTEAIVGKAKSSRGDFTASEDDNVLVQGMANDRNAWVISVSLTTSKTRRSSKPCPSMEVRGRSLLQPKTVEDGTYQPLSRPIFIYVSKKAMDKPEVKEFVEFYLKNAPTLVKAGKVCCRFRRAPTRSGTEHLKKGKIGTVFGGEAEVGVKIEDLMKREAKF